MPQIILPREILASDLARRSAGQYTSALISPSSCLITV
jgi:hypothetical protein